MPPARQRHHCSGIRMFTDPLCQAELIPTGLLIGVAGLLLLEVPPATLGAFVDATSSGQLAGAWQLEGSLHLDADSCTKRLCV